MTELQKLAIGEIRKNLLPVYAKPEDTRNVCDNTQKALDWVNALLKEKPSNAKNEGLDATERTKRL